MTSKDPFTRDIKVGDDWTIPNANGVGRRVIVQGAVWTVPVVAFATNASAAAASGTPTLAFTQPTYSGSACGTISGVQLLRTTDGTSPSPGETVTVTLADGYTFAGGSTTFSDSTDVNGHITLPDIIVPAKGGDSNFLGSSAGTDGAIAPVQASTAGVAKTLVGTAASGLSVYSGVPVNSTSVGHRTFLTPDGQLWSNGAVLANGVTSAVAEYDDTRDRQVVTYIENGVGKTYVMNGGTTTDNNVPAGSTVVGHRTFLAPNGDLYRDNAVIATNVTSAVAQYDDAHDRDLVSYVENGISKSRVGTGAPTVIGPVPAGTVAVGHRYFLTPGGDLYYAGTIIGTGVSSAVAQYDDTRNVDNVTYMENGIAKTKLGAAAATVTAGVPADAVAVGHRYYLTPGGDLYHFGGVVAQNVSSAVAQYDTSHDREVVSYVEAAAC